MTTSPPPADKILVREHYTLHYRNATRTEAWTGAARPAYRALFVLSGAVRWQAGEQTGELQRGGLLVAAPDEEVNARGNNLEVLTLSLAPAFVLDCAVRARLTRDDARITFLHSPSKMTAASPDLRAISPTNSVLKKSATNLSLPPSSNKC
jgi:hypothetical protein